MSLYKSGPATAQLVQNPELPEGILEVVRVFTPVEHRRKGHASMLMHKITSDADAFGIVLLLRPQSFGEDSGMDLISFYARFGFITIQREPVLMARQPRVPVMARGEFASLEV